MVKTKLFAFFLAFGALGLCQTASRYDNFTWGSSYIQGVPTVRSYGLSKVSVCTYPATISNGTCTPLATLYTDVTAGTACNGSNGCSNPLTSDTFGNFGFWAASGHYQFVVQLPTTAVFGPYDITLGGSGGGSSNFNTTASVPTPSTAGKPYLLTSGLENFLIDNGTKVWSPSDYDTNPIAFGADSTGGSGSTSAIQNAFQAVGTSVSQRVYVPSGTYLIDTPLHINREMVLDGAGSGEDFPATTFKLGPKSYVVIDRAGTSPDGGRGDWTVLSNIRFLGTTMSCTATSGNAVLASCNQNPATFLSLSNNDPIVVMGSNGAPWQLNMPQGTTVSSMTSTSITASTTAGFSGAVTVMAGGPLVGVGTTTNASSSITGVTNTSSWQPGDPIIGPGIAYPNFVISVNTGANTLTLFTGTGVTAQSGGNLYKAPLPNLMVKATPRLSNLSCAMSAGHCIDINASASYSPSTVADGWSLDNIRFARAGGLNFHAQGADANAGVGKGLYMAYGAEGCMRDDSFLGGTYVGGECANNGGAGWSTTNANATQVLVNPYQESGYTLPKYSGNTLIFGGIATLNSPTGNFITANGTLSPTFIVQQYGEATADTTNNSATILNVTNISHWNVGDTIVGQCIPASTVVNTTDGVSTLTMAASVGGAAHNAVCTQTGVSIAHTAKRKILGSQSSLESTDGEAFSINTSSYFSYEHQYRDYFQTAEWGWACDLWRNSTVAMCKSTDWAVGKETPPNTGTGAYGNNGGRIKFTTGFWIGSGANADLYLNIPGSVAPTSGSYPPGSWVWPQTPVLANGAAFIQMGAIKDYSTTVTADTTVGSTSLANTSTNFQNSCAPNDWITGTGIENDTIIFSVSGSTAVLNRPATATNTATAMHCGRLPKSHPATTGNTNTSTSITSVSPTSSFANGDMITGTGIPANTYVVSGGGTATLTISQAATSTNTGVTLTDPTTSWATVGFVSRFQYTSLGTAIAAGTCQSQGAVTVTGAAVATTTANQSVAVALPATFQTGISLSNIAITANTVTPYLCNPTAGSITPAATAINVTVFF